MYKGKLKKQTLLGTWGPNGPTNGFQQIIMAETTFVLNHSATDVTRNFDFLPPLITQTH